MAKRKIRVEGDVHRSQEEQQPSSTKFNISFARKFTGVTVKMRVDKLGI